MEFTAAESDEAVMREIRESRKKKKKAPKVD